MWQKRPFKLATKDRKDHRDDSGVLTVLSCGKKRRVPFAPVGSSACGQDPNSHESGYGQGALTLTRQAYQETDFLTRSPLRAQRPNSGISTEGNGDRGGGRAHYVSAVALCVGWILNAPNRTALCWPTERPTCLNSHFPRPHGPGCETESRLIPNAEPSLKRR